MMNAHVKPKNRAIAPILMILAAVVLAVAVKHAAHAGYARMASHEPSAASSSLEWSQDAAL